ncbi:MAG: hypothetical protein SNJ84_01895, partial [Verrucomicrobiia bacterium]
MKRSPLPQLIFAAVGRFIILTLLFQFLFGFFTGLFAALFFPVPAQSPTVTGLQAALTLSSSLPWLPTFLAAAITAFPL